MKRNSPEATAILHRMDEVRCNLGDNMQEIVKEARELGEWRSYVKSYPWVCVGAAVAAGYLIAPRRGRTPQVNAQSSAELPNQNRLLAATVPPRGSVRSAVLAFVGNLVVRGVASYVGEQAGKLLADKAAKPSQDNQP